MQEKGVAGVTYTVMDVLDLKIEANSQQVIVDKGTFDALCCDEKEETITKVTKYLDELIRVLSDEEGSTILCVSLLQNFLLKRLLTYLVYHKDYSFTIKTWAMYKLGKDS